MQLLRSLCLLKQIQPVAADVVGDGDRDAMVQRLTVGPDHDDDHGVLEGAVGGEAVEPFADAPRYDLYEVLLHNALVYQICLELSMEFSVVCLSKTTMGVSSTSVCSFSCYIHMH